jgi:amidophosphoribosyltransferase
MEGDMCGIVAVVSADRRPVIRDLANGAHFLQHRGPAYAGLFVWDPVHRAATLEKGEGLADDIFKPLDGVLGDVGLAHTRYKTSGGGGARNAQPFYDPVARIALAHNGHITNDSQIRGELADRDEALSTDCDGEALLRVLALWFEHYRSSSPSANEREAMFQAIAEVQERVTGSFSVVAATPTGAYAFRDPHGFRPMVRGVRRSGHRPAAMVCSETLALEQNGFEVLDDLPRGHAAFTGRDLEIDQRELVVRDPRPCAFELIYFADVDSWMMGDRNRSHRWRAGRALAMYVLEQAPELAETIDLVVPIPHSPIPGAEAFAQKIEKDVESTALQYATPVSKYRFGGRIFMEETQVARDEAAMLDFRVDAKAVEGKNVFLVDDSVVRGTNASRIARAMRVAGASWVGLGALWPMVIDSCFQGVNTPTQGELIGARFNGSVEEVRRQLGLDALFYLPTEVFQDKVLKGQEACMACVTGHRAVAFEYAGNVLPPVA